MNFITSITELKMIKMFAPEYIKSIADNLQFKSQEFTDNCEKGKWQEADRIIQDNLQAMLKCTNIRYALKHLADKFPELKINLSDTTSCSEMVKRIGKNADAMIVISKERKNS